MYQSLLQLCLFYFGIFGINCQNPEVEIPQGRLLGAIRNNIDGGTFYSFQNIPYARPPIGELRFRVPEPADGWEGIRDATQDLPWCVQPSNFMGQEDCLYLNVYTPGIPAEDITQLPVMVWIHGGAFFSGSAAESVQGPQYLLTKDVVVVAINYRLGIFGFLSLDDPNLGVTGNAGMKDQVLALEWVRDNIEYFGGNPNDVTIFGGSAGSMSVQLHLLSPMSNGLFHKAISQSGDALTEILRQARRNTGELIAQALNIQTENWEDMLASLQEASVNDLSLAEAGLNTNLFRFFSLPIVEISSSGTFLERDPIDIIRSGDYNPVPFIIGTLEAEGLLFQIFSLQQTGENLLIEDFTEFVPSEFNVEGTPLEDLIAFVIRQFYYGDTQPSRDNVTAAIDLSTDFVFAFSSYRTVREYVRTADNPIYFYYFTAITNLNYLKLQDEFAASYPAAGHGDDAGYVFYVPEIPSFYVGSVEERGYKNIINLWTNFVIYGNPTPEGSDFIWEPVTEEQFNYLHIDTCGSYPVLNSVYAQERMEFWWALYEQYASR